MLKAIYGGKIYTATFTNGRTLEMEARDIDGAIYIASNTAALYGWGRIDELQEVTE